MEPICSKCSKPLNSDSKFCHHCGASVSIPMNRGFLDGSLQVSRVQPEQSAHQCLMCGRKPALAGIDYCADCEAKSNRKPAEWDKIRAAERKPFNTATSDNNKTIFGYLAVGTALVAACVALGFGIGKAHRNSAILDLVTQGQICYSKQDYQGAIQAYHQALSLHPDHGSEATQDTVENINWRMGINYFCEGDVAAHGGDFETGIADYTTGLSCAPNETRAQQVLQLLENQQAMRLKTEQEDREAQSQQLAEAKTEQNQQVTDQKSQQDQQVANYKRVEDADFAAELQGALDQGGFNSMESMFPTTAQDLANGRSASEVQADVSKLTGSINQLKGMLPSCNPAQAAEVNSMISRETSEINGLQAGQNIVY